MEEKIFDVNAAYALMSKVASIVPRSSGDTFTRSGSISQIVAFRSSPCCADALQPYDLMPYGLGLLQPYCLIA